MAMFRSRAGTAFMITPPISISPEVGKSTRAIICRRVDLPQPEGPSTVTISLSATSNETWSTARKHFEQILVTSRRRMDAIFFNSQVYGSWLRASVQV